MVIQMIIIINIGNLMEFIDSNFGNTMGKIFKLKSYNCKKRRCYDEKKEKEKKQDIHYMAHEFMLDYNCGCLFCMV